MRVSIMGSHRRLARIAPLWSLLLLLLLVSSVSFAWGQSHGSEQQDQDSQQQAGNHHGNQGQQNLHEQHEQQPTIQMQSSLVSTPSQTTTTSETIAPMQMQSRAEHQQQQQQQQQQQTSQGPVTRPPSQQYQQQQSLGFNIQQILATPPTPGGVQTQDQTQQPPQMSMQQQQQLQQQQLPALARRPPLVIATTNERPQQQQQQQHSITMQYSVSPSIMNHDHQPQQQQQQQQPPPRQQQQQQQPQQQQTPPPPAHSSYAPSSSYASQHHSNYPLYSGHNPFIEILKPHSYADDNIVTLNLSHSHIYEIDSDAFVGQRFEHIDLSNNKLGLIHSRSFRIGPNHSKHNPYHPNSNNSKTMASGAYPTRRPPPSHPKSVTIDFSHNPAIVALSGAFDHIDVPNCLLNFTNSTVELKFGAFKKYLKEHPGHIIDIESVDCCEQEWLLGYKHNFVFKTHCEHDPSLFLSKVPQQTIIDSCIAYVTRARHSMTIQGPSIIHQVAAAPRGHSNAHQDNQYLTYVILGGTAMILTSLSIYIIFYMFSLKAAFVYQMQQPPTSNQHKS